MYRQNESEFSLRTKVAEYLDCLAAVSWMLQVCSILGDRLIEYSAAHTVYIYKCSPLGPWSHFVAMRFFGSGVPILEARKRTKPTTDIHHIYGLRWSQRVQWYVPNNRRRAVRLEDDRRTVGRSVAATDVRDEDAKSL